MTTSTLFHSLPHQGAKHSWRSFIASRWTHRKKNWRWRHRETTLPKPLKVVTILSITLKTTNYSYYSVVVVEPIINHLFQRYLNTKICFNKLYKSKRNKKTWKKLGISSISFSYMGFILKCLLSQNNISKAPGVPVKLSWAVTGLKAWTQFFPPSRELTYPTWGKGKYGKSSSNMPYQGDMLISWRVSSTLQGISNKNTVDGCTRNPAINSPVEVRLVGKLFFFPIKNAGDKAASLKLVIFTPDVWSIHTLSLWNSTFSCHEAPKETHESAGLSGMGALIINVWDTKGSHERHEMQVSVSRNKWNTILKSSGMSR